jgi:RecQ family ATP-dependent DNA helicase
MLNLLKTHFGYDQFRPLQEEIISHIVSKKDTLVLMPTGGGKSICYQLPALFLGGVTLVVSPLIALMKDQVDALKANGIAAEFINSSLSFDDIATIQQKAKQGLIYLLYVAPERLAQENFRSFLKTLDLKLIAIDEAHCISEWGHDFRKEYRNLASLRTLFPGLPIVALTATATPKVADDIVAQLGLRDAKRFVASFDRPNLKFSVRDKKQTFQQIVGLIRKFPNESVIIYCLSRKDTESLAEDLTDLGFKALPYHAGLEPQLRRETQEKFIRDEIHIIVATIAFGMGIDKSNIRLVIHHSFPKSIEGYYQEIGRAGRDSLPSECVLFFGWSDKFKHQYFINQVEDPEFRKVSETKMKQVTDYCRQQTCRRQTLLSYFGETPANTNCGNCDRCLGESPSANESPENSLWQSRPTTAAKRLEITDFEKPLFDDLRELRKRLADEAHVPPYVVFSDVSLREMAHFLPGNLDQFLNINGVGQRKLEKYGEPFLKIIGDYRAKTGLKPKSVPTRQMRRLPRVKRVAKASGHKYDITRLMVSEKTPLKTIAERLGIQQRSLVTQIEKLVDNGEPLDLNYLKPPRAVFDAINSAIDQCGDTFLKPIFEFLKESQNYENIQIVRMIRKTENNRH